MGTGINGLNKINIKNNTTFQKDSPFLRSTIITTKATIDTMNLKKVKYSFGTFAILRKRQTPQIKSNHFIVNN